MWIIIIVRGVDKMKKIRVFMEKNKWITGFFFVSLFIIVSYIWTMEWPELFDGAEEIYNLFFQLAIGYIINFMFYITQVYIPNSNRDNTVRKCISKRIEHLINDMDASISHLVAVYAKEHSGKHYTDEELNALLNLRFSDKVNVLNASKTTRDNLVYFSVREWLIKCITDTENDIDNLYKYYANDISTDLMEVLEAIPRSTYHSIMKTLLSSPNDTDFSECHPNFFLDYYHLIQKLESIKNNDYS